MQALVGPIIQPASDFEVSPTVVILDEGQETRIMAKARGAIG